MGPSRHGRTSMTWLWLLWLASAAASSSAVAATTTAKSPAAESSHLRSRSTRNLETPEDSTIRLAVVDRREMQRLRFQPHDRQGVVEPLRRLQENKEEEESTSVWNKKYVGARTKNWLYFLACLVVLSLTMVNIFTCCSWCCCVRETSQVDSRDRLDTLDSKNMDEQNNPVASSMSSCWCCPLCTSSSRGRLNGSDPEQAPESAVGEKKLVLLPPSAVAVADGGGISSSSSHRHLTTDDQSTSHSATSGDVAESEIVAPIVETSTTASL
jgi:hypothetical protein